MVHLGVCYQLEKLWRPSPWLLFTSIGPLPNLLPSTGAIGATLGTATNNLYFSPKKVYTHYITLMFYFNWIWRRSLKFAKFWPLGPSPWAPMWPHVPYEHLWIPGPWGWFLPSLVKIQPCISSRSRWTVTFDIGPPPQPVTPQGPLGPPWELPPTTFILHLRRYLHFT